MKRRENEEILKRIRYLKTKCICRLYCTGWNDLILKKKITFDLGSRSACEELMYLDTKIST